MTNTTEATDLLVTSCPNHGVKAVSDLRSLATYVEMAREDDRGWVWDNASKSVSRLDFALRFDLANDSDPWRCCWHMVIDPLGICDH